LKNLWIRIISKEYWLKNIQCKYKSKIREQINFQFYECFWLFQGMASKYEGSYTYSSIILSNSIWQRFSVGADWPIFARSDCLARKALSKVLELLARRWTFEVGSSLAWARKEHIWAHSYKWLWTISYQVAQGSYWSRFQYRKHGYYFFHLEIKPQNENSFNTTSENAFKLRLTSN